MVSRSEGAKARPLETRVSRLLLTNALANTGGVIAFLPLLSFLLPIKIEHLVGDARLGLMAATVIVGALAASVSNVFFGWLSDRAVARGGGRRAWLAGGLAATVLSYAGVAMANSSIGIVAAIAVFQVAVNALLAPMFAIMADEIPDSHKRTAGGLLALGSPMGAAVSAGLMSLVFVDEAGRLAIVAAAVVLCILPVLLTRGAPAAAPPPSPAQQEMLRGDLLIAWTARLLVQIAGAMLSYYCLYYFESVAPGETRALLASRVGHILTIGYFIPLPLAVLVGRWSDRTQRGKPFLFVAGLVATLGLTGMALAQDWATAAVAYIVFQVGLSVFVTLHMGFAMQLLPDPKHRARDLGLINLTNTLPQLLGPGMAWLLATPQDFDAALWALAGLTACGGVMILGVRGRR